LSEFLDSKNLIVTFGGLGAGIGQIKPFEFFNMLKKYRCSKIFVRDFYERWYFKGISEEINTPKLLEGHISHLIKESDAKRIIFLGSSAGGFAAIKFGNNLCVDVVHAFGPQTFLDAESCEKYDDERWPIQRKELQDIETEKNLNLKYIKQSKTVIKIHYCSKNRNDTSHVENISNLRIKKFPRECHMHGIARRLRNKGMLDKILSKELL